MKSNKNYHLQSDGTFVIDDYNNMPVFSNFLPGIAGIWGIPLWVFYVNRGQAIASFGIKDKEHSISEFLPANKAYWLTAGGGFRTFIKINRDICYEPFCSSSSKKEQSMEINSYSLKITETNPELGLVFSVRYFTMPGTAIGGLVRVFSVKNISSQEKNIEVIDGLARITPFGTGDFFLKSMSRTVEAWMRSFIFDNLAVFRLIVDPSDVSETKYIEGVNFNCSFYEQAGVKISPLMIVDPQAVFGVDTSYSYPRSFFQESFKSPTAQITCGKTPCSFSSFSWQLSAGEEKFLFSIFGAGFKLESVKDFCRGLNADFIQSKEKENKEIIEGIKSNCFCVSGFEEFNEYLSSTYLDNILRGGLPYKLNGNDIQYVFSRKHGDLERDYNRFELLPSYFSEGEGNYRDTNQNRRMDLLFNPFIGMKNVFYFAGLIRMDGYNPLTVKGEKLYFSQKEAKAVLKEFKIEDKDTLKVMVDGFRLGEIFNLLEARNIAVKDKQTLARRIVQKAKREPFASFGEGFWIDHWFYNLDLIENFLYIYPDKLTELFLTKEILCWDDEHKVKERENRYQIRDNRVLQGESIEVVEEKRKILSGRKQFKNFLRTKTGEVYKSTLAEKLLVLILNKAASFDPDGIGVEMEAGKPGWCDSLNGLPALFGSSLSEAIELKRACSLLLSVLAEMKNKQIGSFSAGEEICSFFARLCKLLSDYFFSEVKSRDYFWWDKANSLKEEFRRKAFFAVSGKEKELKIGKLEKFLQDLIEKINNGRDKAKDKDSGVYYTYFTYELKKYKIKNKVVCPFQFIRKPLPLFLEGPAHILKVEKDRDQYDKLRDTSLFDKELKMYRLNSSLEKEPLEIGRSRVFVPGWLENESIWLHMQYKYLLEVLRSGFYKQFWNDFYSCCVGFFDPKRYGRSIFENSSFIVSSAYPDKDLWGRGFVARLSGATVEMLNIWALLVLGREPFFLDKASSLCVKFSPLLAGEMFTTQSTAIDWQGKKITVDKNCFVFKLFSSVLIVYHNPERIDTFENNCKVEKIIVESEGAKHTFSEGIIPAPHSYRFREAKISRIDVFLQCRKV